MKNILHKFRSEQNARLDEHMFGSVKVPLCDNEQARDIVNASMKKALFAVVSDAGNVSPRYAKHWVKNAVEGLVDGFYNFKKCHGVCACVVSLVLFFKD